MATVIHQIKAADEVICQNIEQLAMNRSLMAQNILGHLRNLVEGVAVLLHTRNPDAEFNWDAIKAATGYIKGIAKFSGLARFHKLLQISKSHYAHDGDTAERLMLKYYEYLLRLRELVRLECGIHILSNLENCPLDLDETLTEYYSKIAAKIRELHSIPTTSGKRQRCYIHKVRPFFVDKRIFYEVTLYPSINRVAKTDRFVAFTDIDITDHYAAMLTFTDVEIEMFGQRIPITIIYDWSTAIRPCEFDNFGRLLGIETKIRSESREYRSLMSWLTEYRANLLDLMDMDADEYRAVQQILLGGVRNPQIFELLDKARTLIQTQSPGHNVLRYLMLRMNNHILKRLYDERGCEELSGLKLRYGCIPFDTMPLCTSLPDHNPRYWDVVESIDVSGREHELLARRVRNNTEVYGVLYTSVEDLKEFGEVAEIEQLISTHNKNLYLPKHRHRELILDRDLGLVFIRSYEDDTVSIIEMLQQHASSGIRGYTESVERWLEESPFTIDDPEKQEALKRLFSQSRVAVIYGAAGTGKSTMVNHIAHYFHDKSKLFLAHTNPAVANLQRKVTAQNSEFRTIHSHILRTFIEEEYDLLVIDECSTVSNRDLLTVLQKTRFKLLLLVGDVYQIEAIQFGNWFGLLKSFIPSTAVFELKRPFRTTNQELVNFWEKVRKVTDDIAEHLATHGFSSTLDETLFRSEVEDEIVLCLNYDGIYGINNINRLLQNQNPAPAVTWGLLTYKVGDPVLFFDTDRFRPVIYNNLKGWIVNIERFPDRIQFDVKLDRRLTELDVETLGGEMEWVDESTVRFSVYDPGDGDDDDESNNTTVPFHVAYAVSIHKAQGLEYDSVKVVITDDHEEDLTHNIFYTAITRARQRLRIYWTPEVQQRVLQRLRPRVDPRDLTFLCKRRGLRPVNNSGTGTSGDDR